MIMTIFHTHRQRSPPLPISPASPALSLSIFFFLFPLFSCKNAWRVPPSSFPGKEDDDDPDGGSMIIKMGQDKEERLRRETKEKTIHSRKHFHKELRTLTLVANQEEKRDTH